MGFLRWETKVKSLYRFFTLLILLLTSAYTKAEIQVTDLAGRNVTLPKVANKVVLGEGRFLSVLGVLGVKDPISHVAGMMNEFKTFDPATYTLYKQAFPTIDNVPTFGHTSEQSVSVEKIILLEPDVAIFGLNGHGPGSKSKHIISKLEAAGIPVVFIDFRQDPINNSIKSVELVGKLLGKESVATDYAELYKTEFQKVTDVVSTLDKQDYASVLFELRASIDQPCCLSVAKGLFADMALAAGGYSIADGLLPGPVGQLSFEHVIESDVDVYIGSAIGAVSELEQGQQARRLILGAGVDTNSAQYSLNTLLKRQGFAHISAVKSKRAHSLWHHFYNSPLNIYAIQKMAKWFHPNLFVDLEPEKTLDELLKKFDQVDLTGTYAISN